MKRIILLITIISLFPIIVIAKTYDMPDEKMHITFNDDWTVFTRENLENNTQLDDFNLTYDYMKRVFFNNDIYIDGIYQDKTLELFLRIKNVKDIDNIANYNDEKLENIANTLGEKANADKSYVFKNKYNYIVTEYKDGNYNILSYYTIINSKGYTYTIQTTNSITDKEKKIMKEIIETITYDVTIKKEKELNVRVLAEIFIIIVIVLIILLNIFKRISKRNGLKEL